MAKKRKKNQQPGKKARIPRGENPVTVEKLLVRSILRDPRFRTAVGGRRARAHGVVRLIAEIKDGHIVFTTSRKEGPNSGIVWPIRPTRGHQFIVQLSDSTYQEIISTGRTTYQVTINPEVIMGGRSVNSKCDNEIIK